MTEERMSCFTEIQLNTGFVLCCKQARGTSSKYHNFILTVQIFVNTVLNSPSKKKKKSKAFKTTGMVNFVKCNVIP